MRIPSAQVLPQQHCDLAAIRRSNQPRLAQVNVTLVTANFDLQVVTGMGYSILARTKLIAICLSAAFMAAAGAFYVQVFQYIDPGIAYGPGTSIEALVAAIVGGMGTLWGPVLGALALHLLGDLTRNLFGQLPGINLVIYGVNTAIAARSLMLSPRTGPAAAAAAPQ